MYIVTKQGKIKGLIKTFFATYTQYGADKCTNAPFILGSVTTE